MRANWARRALIWLAVLHADRGDHAEATLKLGRASYYVAQTRGEPYGEEALLYEATNAATLAALRPEEHARLLAADSRVDLPTQEERIG